MIHSNEELYAFVRQLVEELRRTGEGGLSQDLADAMLASSMPSEVLGGIRQQLRRVLGCPLCRDSEWRIRVDDGIRSIDAAFDRVQVRR